MDIDVFTGSVDRLGDVDPTCFADAESIIALHRQRERVDAIVTEATAAFEAAGNYAPDGARTAAAWLMARCKLPRVAARRLVRRGRALRHLPAFARAWRRGDITGTHIDAVANVRRPATEEVLARDEAMLVEQATTLPFRGFTRALAYWEQHADPDGVEDNADRQRSRRTVFLDSTFDGMWLGNITLDPVSGAIVAGELARIENELFEAEWNEATGREEPDHLGVKLSRTPGQRRADALVEMAVRSRGAGTGDKRPAPLFSVLVGYETLHGRICQLANGTVVTPGSLLPYLDEALIERVVFSPGARVEVSATARLFSGATRRAVLLRDQECAHPFCDESERRLQVDHIVPFAEGGLTVQENGRILCGFHNRLRNGREPPDEE
ncbi:MAG: DUF222 domain-containing protein [Acidimicrobiales bacterium]